MEGKKVKSIKRYLIFGVILIFISSAGCGTTGSSQTSSKILEDFARGVEEGIRKHQKQSKRQQEDYKKQQKQRKEQQQQWAKKQFKKQQKVQLEQSTKELEIIAKINQAINPINPITRTFALRLAREFPGEYNVWQVCAIYEYLKQNWRYVNDPRGIEYIASADQSIVAGLAGDCDDFAVLVASLIEAIGGSSRIILARDYNIAHAYAEVYIGKNPQEANKVIDGISFAYQYGHIMDSFIKWLEGRNYVFSYRSESSGCWLNLDWTAKHPGGPYQLASLEIAVYSNGNFGRIK